MSKHVTPPLVALALALSAPAAPASEVDPRIIKILDTVSEERLAQIVAKLQGFGTRHTLSAADASDRGIGAARQWILDEMKRSSARLQVSFDTYDIPAQGERITREVQLRNVMAVLPGRSARRIYVSGHYDSLARPAGARREPAAPAQSASGGFDWTRGDNPAPGANDDGSGTALTMELARVFGESGIEFDATLVFIAFAGEEQGLVGAKLHAQKARAEGSRIDAVFNNDIVGNVTGGGGAVDSWTVRVFSEGPEDSPSRQLARYVRRFAARYLPAHVVRLVARQDRFGRGGDHIAFNQHGYAGVRFSESKENYARQHTVEDTDDGVSAPYLARNTRVNAAALASLALAPPAPVVAGDRGRPLIDRQPSGYDARLRWQPSPGAVAYRVFWRDSWSPDWQHELTVGSVTETVLRNVSIDDHVFGVAAVGPGGQESLVSAYVNPPRPEVEIKTKAAPQGAQP
jgi:hypothetical protein